MDAKLHWKEHAEEIRHKARKTVNALPQIMYVCSIWSNASMKGKLYTRRMLNTMQTIQARAARVISGAYRATSRAALDIEWFLLSIEQQIWKHNADTVT